MEWKGKHTHKYGRKPFEKMKTEPLDDQLSEPLDDVIFMGCSVAKEHTVFRVKYNED